MASLGELRLRAGPYQILAILLLQICEGVFRVADVLSMTLFYSFLFFSVLVLVLCAAGIVSGTLPANVELAEFEERFHLELLVRGTGGV
ncbi:unnamed protein product [Sphagnum troendelagicum]|uniref:Uncharacterized protein n=1 Tax=Sphagnum jensenii TaxID=128206 RepID=A0ABP0WNT9_9BRYO